MLGVEDNLMSGDKSWKRRSGRMEKEKKGRNSRWSTTDLEMRLRETDWEESWDK